MFWSLLQTIELGTFCNERKVKISFVIHTVILFWFCWFLLVKFVAHTLTKKKNDLIANAGFRIQLFTLWYNNQFSQSMSFIFCFVGFRELQFLGLCDNYVQIVNLLTPMNLVNYLTTLHFIHYVNKMNTLLIALKVSFLNAVI